MRLLSRILLYIACTLLGTSTFAQTPADDDRWRWNLEHLFPDVAAWDAERQRLLAEFPKLASYKGTLGNSSADLSAALRFTSDTYRAALRVYVYANLQQDEDLRDNAAQERNQLAEAMFARFTQESAWMDPELIAVGEDRIRAFMADNPDLAPFRYQLDNTLRQASHTLGAEAEEPLGQPRPLEARVSSDQHPPAPVMVAEGGHGQIFQGALPEDQSSLRYCVSW